MLKKSLLALSLGISVVIFPSVALGQSGTISQLNQWLVSGGYIKMASSTAGLRVPSLNCTANTNGGALTADASGNVTCSNDDGGGAGSQTPWTSTIDGAGYSLTNAGTLTAAKVVATSTLSDSTFIRTTITNGTTTNATSTNLSVSGRLNLFGTIGTALSDFCVSITGSAGLCDGNDASGGGGSGVGTIATSTVETANQVPYYTSTNGYPALLGSDSGFTYNPSPAEIVTMSNGTVTGELRANTLRETTGVAGFDISPTDITTLLGSGGYFILKDGASAFSSSIDTSALTGNVTQTLPNQSGTFALLSDITNASSTLLGDNNTWTGVNRIGGDTNNLTLGTGLLYQRGTDYPQQPQAVFGNSLSFSFNQAASAGDSGSGISFTANDGGTGDTNGGSIEFTTGAPSGTGATGTIQINAGTDLIFESATSTFATSTFYSNVNVTGGLKIGTASINLVSGATSTFDGGINLTNGGCFSINNTCVGGGSGSLTGTAGQVAYFSAANTAVGTSSLFINTTNSNIGIGNTNPAAGLSIAGLQDPIGSNSATIGGLTTYPLALQNNTVNTGSSTGIAFGVSTTANTVGGAFDFVRVGAASAGDFVYKLNTVGGVSLVERMRLSNAGNLGVGTSSPYAMLSVAGEAVAANFTATSTIAVSSFQQFLARASTTLQNFTALNATTSQATSTNFFATNLWGTRAVVGNATATGVIAVQGTGTSTYTGGIRALTAQFDALTAAACDLKADTSGNMYCGTDANTGGNAASTTANFSIFKAGTTYYAYNSSTTVTTSNTNFSTLLQSVVDVMDGSAGGGSIYIHAGTYYAGATTTISGNGTAFWTPGGAIRIWGAGVGATKIVTTGNADFLAFDSVAVPMVSDLSVYVNGSSHALYANSSDNEVRSMWMFYFANMQITSTSSATAIPVYLGNALRGMFSNIEYTDTAGCAYFYAEGNWNPGDFTYQRSFCELQTTSGLSSYTFASTTSGGHMNQVSFDMVEGIATGVNQTFINARPVKFSKFTNLNAEQYDTLVDGYNFTVDNEFGFNYATHRLGIANLRGCRFGNTLNGVAGLATRNTCSFKFLENDASFSVVDDMNTDVTRPNMITGFFGSDAGTASASTGPSTLTIYRDISFYGTLDNNLAPSGKAGVFQVYGPLQARSSKTASSSIRSDATSTFATGISISTGCFAIANVCLSSGGSGASSTLLADNNIFSGQNIFANILRSTTTAATTTNLAVTNAPTFTALTGLMKANGSAPASVGVNGTDFTLISASTCGAGQHFSAVTAAGAFTCTADSGGGGGGGSGIGWTWNNVNSLYMSTSTDDLLLGATATSSNAKFEVINNGLLAWFASTTGATIRPILSVFRNTTTGKSGIGINSSSTEDTLTVNGYTNLDPQLLGCDLMSNIGTVTTDQLTGQLCDMLSLDSITDGGILQDTATRGIEEGMPYYTILRTGDTTSWAANEGVWLKTNKAIPASTTLMVEAYLRTPKVNVATTTGTYVFGLGNVGVGSLTTTAAYAAPTDTCSFQASSTANWIAVVRKGSTYNAWDIVAATSTTLSTFSRFRVTQDLVNGCQFMINGTVVASEPAATSPVVPMQFVLGIGNNGAGVGTIGTSQNHYFYFAEPRMGWGRWKPK